MPDNRNMTGFVNRNICDHSDASDTGCSVGLAEGPASFGPTFNADGGGFYAMEQTNDFVKVWFWARGNPNTPADVLNGSETINTDAWVKPLLYNIDFTHSHLANLRRVFRQPISPTPPVILPRTSTPAILL